VKPFLRAAINGQLLRAPAIPPAATRFVGRALLSLALRNSEFRKNAGYASDAASLFIETKLGFGLKHVPEQIDAFEKSDSERAANLP
jgi:hypothetical protein